MDHFFSLSSDGIQTITKTPTDGDHSVPIRDSWVPLLVPIDYVDEFDAHADFFKVNFFDTKHYSGEERPLKFYEVSFVGLDGTIYPNPYFAMSVQYISKDVESGMTYLMLYLNCSIPTAHRIVANPKKYEFYMTRVGENKYSLSIECLS